jgi:tetratricopeptide (TPR) repeat protein
MDKLGESRRHQGRLAESIELLTKAVDGMKTQLPDTDPATYHAVEQLGITLRACFRFEDARQHQEQALAGMKLCLGERDARTLITIEELAITYKELGTVHMESNKELAQQYLETAHRHAIFVVEQRTKQLGDKQPRTWMAQGSLGRIKAAMGDFDEAERLFSSILPVASRHLGDDHLGVLSHKNYYCKMLIQQKRYREAETLLLDISRSAKYKSVAFTEDHLDRWDALWTLVECYQKQGKIDRSLATCNELLGAVRAIRQGREQTETSSTFWEMVQDKRAELVAIKNSGIVEDSTSLALGSPSDNLAPAELHPAVHTISSNSHIVATPEFRDLRLRSTTWSGMSDVIHVDEQKYL